VKKIYLLYIITKSTLQHASPSVVILPPGDGTQRESLHIHCVHTCTNWWDVNVITGPTKGFRDYSLWISNHCFFFLIIQKETLLQLQFVI